MSALVNFSTLGGGGGLGMGRGGGGGGGGWFVIMEKETGHIISFMT